MDHRTKLVEVYAKIHAVEQELLRLKACSAPAEAGLYDRLCQEHRLLRLGAAQLKHG
jgi:hypothetical protein